MSQIAEPVIAGLEVVEHFGEAPEVLARLMAAPVVRARRPAPSSVDRLRSEHSRCVELSWRLLESCSRVSRAYSRALPLIEDAIAGAAGRSARALRLDALAAVAAADALGAGAAAGAL